MDDDDSDTDNLLREVAAAPVVPVPADLATLVLLEPGVVVDGVFRIEERLGAGGMGVVYAARDLRLDREVALKLMRLDRIAARLGASLPEVFEREARATARLNHPNVVTLHQFGNWNGLLYLVLERLRGETLHARLERARLPLTDGLAILEQVARALDHTHAAGITHRDLKPHNVYLLPGGHVKVLDFGVSGLARAAVVPPSGGAHVPWRSTLSSAGTPGYMAPEQWSGGAQDGRTDLWALGVMLHQLVTGALPFGFGVVTEKSIAPALADRLPPAAADLAPLIARCLVVRRDQRQRSAAEVADALREVRARLTGESLPSARVRSRRRARRVAAGVGAVVVLGVAFTALTRQDDAGAACADATARMDEVWGPAQRERLGARFASGPARATWDTAARTLDVYATQWAPLRESACRTSAAAPATCLDDRLVALRELVARADTDADAMEAADVLAAARSLPPLANCADPEYLAALPASQARRDPRAAAPMALTLGGQAFDMIHDGVAIGDDVAITGFAGADAALLGKPLVAPGSNDVIGFVARIGHDGRERWRSVLRATRPRAIAAAPGGDVVIAGYFSAGAVIGDVAAPATRTNDCLIASLDAATGATRWVRTCGATWTGEVRSLAVDAAGNIYVAGEFGGRASFGGATEYDAATRPATAPFVASWAADGTLRWVAAGAGTASSRSRAIAVDGDALVVASTVAGAGELAGHRLTAGGCVLARLDPATGAVRWVREEPGEDGECSVRAVAIRDGRLIAAGAEVLRSAGAWVAEHDLATGERRWIRTFGGDVHFLVSAVGLDADGFAVAGGQHRTDGFDVDGVPIVGHGDRDGFLLRFDRGGRCVGGLGIGGPREDRVRWLDVAPSGHVLTGGRFELEMEVSGHDLRAVDGPDAFLLELAPEAFTPSPPPPREASP